MDQQPLWVDSLEDALRDCVSVAGGPKRVAATLWPARKMSDAARHLNHCLDPDRPEKLTLGEIELIVDAGKQAGCHTFMHYLAQRLGYTDPSPVEPEDAKAELQKAYINATRQIAQIAVRLERLGT